MFEETALISMLVFLTIVAIVDDCQILPRLAKRLPDSVVEALIQMGLLRFDR